MVTVFPAGRGAEYLCSTPGIIALSEFIDQSKESGRCLGGDAKWRERCCVQFGTLGQVP